MRFKTDTENGSAPQFPDKGNLPKPKWRAALAALLAPAVRVHRYRNLRSATFYAAMCEHDCGKPS